MPPSRRANDDTGNRILLSLPQNSLKRLRPVLELRNLAKSEIIDRPDRPIEYLHFFDRGLTSFVKTMQAGRSVEIGMVGIEGISNPQAPFGINKAVLDSIVQIPGSVFRIKRADLIQKIAADNALQEALEKHTHFSVAAFAQTAARNRLHYREERCCRWWLIARAGRYLLADPRIPGHDARRATSGRLDYGQLSAEGGRDTISARSGDGHRSVRSRRRYVRVLSRRGRGVRHALPAAKEVIVAALRPRPKLRRSLFGIGQTPRAAAGERSSW